MLTLWSLLGLVESTVLQKRHTVCVLHLRPGVLELFLTLGCALLLSDVFSTRPAVIFRNLGGVT